MRNRRAGFAFFLTAGIFCLWATVQAAPPTFTISGTVQTAAGVGVSGVDVVGNNGATSAVTGADGAYAITVSNNWSGMIAVSKAGWVITPTSRSYSNIKTDIASENYLAYQPKISGVVTKSDGTPLAGATVEANNGGGSSASDANGYYEFYVPYGWSGAVSATLSGYGFTAKNYSTVIADQTNQDFSGYQPTISGYVRKSDGTPLAGAAVEANNGGGSATSDASGYYEVVVPYNWSGVVTVSLAGYGFTGKNYLAVTTDQVNQNFSGFEPTISGSTGVAGVTVTVSGVGSVISTPAYSVVVPYGWSGIVSASLTGYNFADSPKSYTNITADTSNQNFTPFRPTVSGYVKKVDGTALSGATVAANNGGGSTTTNSSGYYKITVPYNWSGTVIASLSGYSFTSKSYADVVADHANQDFAGFRPKISGYVRNASGAYLSGSTVTTKNGNGSVLSSTITDVNGYYEIIVPYSWSGSLTAVFNEYSFLPKYYTSIITDQTNQYFTAIYDWSINPGDGSLGNPYQISDPNQLNAIGANVRLLSKCYILTNDIDLSYYDGLDGRPEFNPIGYRDFSGSIPFTGTFDGNGHEISNFTFANHHAFRCGVFVSFDTPGEIRNVKIVNPIIDGSAGFSYMSALVNRADGGVIRNCHVFGGSVIGSEYIGPLVGDNWADIYGCSASSTVRGGDYVGGLVGRNFGHIYNSYATGSVMGRSSVGGLIGLNCSAFDMYGFVQDCYATGTVTGSGYYAGGLIGRVWGGSILRCYANGFVTGNNDVGGLIGAHTTTSWSCEASFWDVQMSGQSISVGGTGLLTADMRTRQTYLDAGWDFSSTWVICDGVSYPYFKWENCNGPCLNISDHTLSFQSLSKTVNPDAQVFTIDSCVGILNWNIDVPGGCDWLSVSPLSNNSDPNITEVTVNINASGLDYGLHSCDLMIYVSDTDNSPQVVTVTLDVLRAQIAVSPASVNIECNLKDSNIFTRVLSISNSGGDTLNWQITEDCGWLSVAPSAGQCVTEADEVTLTVNTEGLEIGTYTCNLTITDGNASNSPVTVPVSLHVYQEGERHVPLEYPTIQAAIDAAVDGDHVVIHPGRYGGYGINRITIHGKSITIRSIDPDNKYVIEKTIISGLRTESYGIELVGSAETESSSSVIEGLVFQDFRSPPIYSNWSSPIIRNCIFKNNAPRYLSTCVYLKNSSAVVENCEFVNNHLKFTKYSAGTIVIDNLESPGAHAVIRNCLFSVSHNDYVYQPRSAPGIYVVGGSLDVSNCTIAYNYTLSNDSYYITTCPGFLIRQANVTINNSIIWGNEANDGSQVGIIISDSGNTLPDSRVLVSHSNIQGGRANILLFPDSVSFYQYTSTQQLPDPNLIDPMALTWGPGNMDADPLFVREPDDGGDGWFPVYTPTGWDYSPVYNNDYGDFHLKSEVGRFVWDGFARADFNLDKQVDLIDFAELANEWLKSSMGTSIILKSDLNRDFLVNMADLLMFCEDYLQPRVFGAWVADVVSSPCIDAGDPADEGWKNELWPHGGRVNMGAYGGTAQASMSGNPVGNTADLNHDGVVDLADWGLWATDWLAERVLLVSDFDRNAVVDVNDLEIFLNNWMVGN